VTGVLPEKLNPPTTNAEKCNDEWKVKIAWEPPINGGVIIKYTLKISSRRNGLAFIESD
jgi:hypothetical protein